MDFEYKRARQKAETAFGEETVRYATSDGGTISTVYCV